LSIFHKGIIATIAPKTDMTRRVVEIWKVRFDEDLDVEVEPDAVPVAVLPAPVPGYTVDRAGEPGASVWAATRQVELALAPMLKNCETAPLPIESVTVKYAFTPALISMTQPMFPEAKLAFLGG